MSVDETLRHLYLQVHEHPQPLRQDPEPSRRPREHRLRPHLLRPGPAAMAGHQDREQHQGEVPEDQGPML
jgi:hypothetical protein